MTPARRRRIRERLLEWYRRHRRELPWRATRDPYAIWVSEVMLQQTRVETVIPYYERFLARFPTPRALAAASEEQVLAAWSGLGYYGRARSLRCAALQLIEQHGGKLPSDAQTLRALPGIGRYTAGAIASIAFGLPEPVLDGNVKRVLCRLETDHGHNEAALWQWAEALAHGPDPGDLNQALMELGATVCTARRPACPACPVATLCRARRAGTPELWPAARARPATTKARVAVAWLRSGGRVLLEQPALTGSPLRGTWDLPAVELAASDCPRNALRRKLRRLGFSAEVPEGVHRVGHAIMQRRLQLEICECTLRGRSAARPDVRWIRPALLDTVAVSGATTKIARLRL